MKASILLFTAALVAILISGCYQKNPYDDIPWSATKISHTGCSQLNGVYRVDKEVWQVFVFIETSSHNQRGYIISTAVEHFKKIPFRDGKLYDKKDVYGRTSDPATGKPYGTFRDEDTSEFWRTAKMSISQEGQKVIATLMDKDGVAYRRVTIGIQNQDVSCNENGFYVRFFTDGCGAEGAPCDVTATEINLSKLKSGDLQLMQTIKGWKIGRIGGNMGDIYRNDTKTWILKKLEE